MIVVYIIGVGMFCGMIASHLVHICMHHDLLMHLLKQIGLFAFLFAIPVVYSVVIAWINKWQARRRAEAEAAKAKMPAQALSAPAAPPTKMRTIIEWVLFVVVVIALFIAPFTYSLVSFSY